MLDLVRTNLLKPLAGRVGTFVAALLVSHGVPAEPAGQVGVGVAVAALIGFDLVASWIGRREATK